MSVCRNTSKIELQRSEHHEFQISVSYKQRQLVILFLVYYEGAVYATLLQRKLI